MSLISNICVTSLCVKINSKQTILNSNNSLGSDMRQRLFFCHIHNIHGPNTKSLQMPKDVMNAQNGFLLFPLFAIGKEAGITRQPRCRVSKYPKKCNWFHSKMAVFKVLQEVFWYGFAFKSYILSSCKRKIPLDTESL